MTNDTRARINDATGLFTYIDGDKPRALSRIFLLTVRQCLIDCAWPGLGLFGESYILFGIGTLQPIFQLLYPQCYTNTNGDDDDDDNNYKSNVGSAVCPTWIVHSMTYSVVVGVMTGMVVVGLLANTIGRRKGSILTAALMSFGSMCMAITVKVFGDSDSSGKLFSTLSVLLFVFGIGVGGEYPLSAASASEKATSSFLQHQRQAKQDHQRAKPSESSKTDDKSIPLITATSTTPVPSMNEVTTAAGLDDELPQPGQQQIIGGELHENSTPTTQSQPSRGRQVQLVFTMQGMGIWVNCITVMLLLWVTGQTGRAGGGDGAVNGNGQNQYDHQKLLLVTQVTYLIGALVLLVVLATRYLFLEESQVWIQDQHRLDSIHKNANTALSLEVPDRRSNDASNENAADGNAGQIYASDAFIIESPETDQKNRSNPKNPHMSTAEVTTSRPPDASEDFNPSHLDLLLRNYGVRLFGASASWLLWDISFYGNKLFQASFLLALTGEQTTLLELSAAATLNATVALLGYFGAALLIDHPGVGRLKLQSGGLFVTGGLFVMCGFSFERMSSSLLVPIYLASSFFGQLGPNATTFTIPTEIFPTEQRTLCHGICASSGKLGALIAAVLFHRLNNDADLFLISGYASFAACLVSLWTIPETNGLNLLELDIKWRMTLEGRKREYDGPANHPDFLSMYERWMKGVAIKNPSHA